MLFIIALVADLVSLSLSGPVTDASDYLAEVVYNEYQFISGMMLEFIAAIAIILIPVMLYPLFRLYNERLAVGYLLLRFFEGIIFVFIIVNSLSLIDIGKEYLDSGAPQNSHFQTLGDSLMAVDDWATLIYIVIFTLGALILYYTLFKSRLLPRFISIWGLIAATLLLVGSILGIYDVVETTRVMLMFGPLVALNEITLSVWLIVKGFNRDALDRLEA